MMNKVTVKKAWSCQHNFRKELHSGSKPQCLHTARSLSQLLRGGTLRQITPANPFVAHPFTLLVVLVVTVF